MTKYYSVSYKFKQTHKYDTVNDIMTEDQISI